jgi:hypothetical protein
MSLTLALILLAAAVLLAIALQGWWAMRRARPRQPLPRPEAPPASAAHRGAHRREPALDGGTPGGAAAVASGIPAGPGATDGTATAAQSPQSGPGAGAAAAGPPRASALAPTAAEPPGRASTDPGDDGPARDAAHPGAATPQGPRPPDEAPMPGLPAFDALPLRPTPRPPQRLDALIDALVTLVPDAPPVSGDAVLAHMPASRHAGTKPWTVEGLDLLSDAWEPITPGRRYAELQAGVQLSSRSGPLNEIEYSEFVQHLESLAEAIGARADLPDMLQVMARARELDSLASPLDAQLSLTLRSNSVAWSVPYVQQVAQRHGFVGSGRPGRYVLPADVAGAPPVLVLTVDPQAALAVLEGDAPASAVREAQLVLDLAQTDEALDPYPAWHRMAVRLAEEFDATPVDDHGQPLSLQAFSAIGIEVDQVYRRLEALDLAAGSAAARRLFS